MLIEIPSPVFKCAEDENIFFSRLHEISGYDGVVGKGLNLYLTLAVTSEDEVAIELQAVCDLWNTRYTVIKQ